MATDSAPGRAAVRSLFDGAETSALGLIAIAAGFAAGILHLVVAPEHFAEHIGQGLFMVTAGFLQVLWAVWFLRRPSLRSYAAGVALALGCIVVWVVATYVRPPFQSTAETPMPTAWATEVIQILGVLVLVILPFTRARAGVTAPVRAFPIVALVLLLGLALGGAAYGAGLAGEKFAPILGDSAGSDSMSPASTSSSSSNSANGGMQMAPASANTSANQSAPAKDANMPSDPSACMSGMDMPGCSAAQADAYFTKMTANAPPPDKTLTPVKIALTNDGTGETGKFTLDNGTMHLLVKVQLKDAGGGPWAVFGPGSPPSGDLQVDFTPPGAKAPSFSVVVKGSGEQAGIDPAANLDITSTGESPMPAMGDWGITVGGSGVNAGLTVTLTERFVM